jgi:tripartite-type tricarboxylate transporter receptor subunit TctC
MLSIGRCLLPILALLAIVPARAEDYPSRTITIVVPLAPGTGMDIIARCTVINCPAGSASR